MARRGGRRGGQGNRGRRSKANRSRSRSTKSSSRSKSTSRRGGQGNKSRSTGRAKGTVSRKSVGKGLRSVAKAVGKIASKTKGFAGVGAAMSAARSMTSGTKNSKSRLRRQLNNLKSNVQQQSTKEARYKRRADRLRRQHGLDYSRMNDSFKANVNVSQAYKALGLNKFAPARAVYNRLPRSLRDFSWSHQFKAPTKLGVRDGYRAPNRGPAPVRGVPRQDDVRRQAQRPATGPQQDWLGSLYSSHNISGGKLDQTARDYWSNEAKTKGIDAVTQSIIGTSKAQGTYGGRKKPQSISTGSRRIGGGPMGIGLGLATLGLRGPKTSKPRKNLTKTLAASTAALGLRGG